jgi:hypothetical protein
MTMKEALQHYDGCIAAESGTCEGCAIAKNGICEKLLEIEDILDGIKEVK